MTPKSKICTKCDIEKPLEEFSRQKGGKFGRRAHCKVCMAEYREANREQRRQYKKANRERLLEQKRRYYEANRERLLEQKRRYYEANPEKFAANWAKRRAAKINRTPAWADLDHIQQFYEARKAISDATGRDYHVDHEIPLQGKTVSGLHVPSNLQIIPAERNLSKNNTF
jgi:hypothetical protein